MRWNKRAESLLFFTFFSRCSCVCLSSGVSLSFTRRPSRMRRANPETDGQARPGFWMTMKKLRMMTAEWRKRRRKRLKIRRQTGKLQNRRYTRSRWDSRSPWKQIRSSLHPACLSYGRLPCRTAWRARALKLSHGATRWTHTLCTRTSLRGEQISLISL